MGILSTTRSRFNNSNSQNIKLIKVVDPLHDMFTKASFNLIRNIAGNETDHIALRIKASALFYRVSSFIGNDFKSVSFSQYLESELEEFSTLASQFEATEGYAESIVKSLHLMQERKINYKREAIAKYISQVQQNEEIVLLERGHKWRSLEIDFTPIPDANFSTISFDSGVLKTMGTVLVSTSPSHLSKNLQKELFFSGLAESLVVFLYGKEKLRLPQIPVFVASNELDDSSLIPEPKVALENFTISDTCFVEDSSDEFELELVEDDCPPNSERVLKVLLVSNEEVCIRPWDYVWCDDQGHLSHITAAEMAEGMRLLIRSDHHVEKPEEYLDRSEIWRTPLRNIINMGVSCDLLSRGIEHRAGVTVNSRMVRSWIDGSVLGPEELSVFFQLIEELKIRGYLDRSTDESEVQSWWKDLENARLAQTSKGVKNRTDALKQAQHALAEDNDKKGAGNSLFEFSEVLAIDRVWIDSSRSDSIGISNHRNMRVFS